MTDIPTDVDRLAAIIDPDAFDDTVKKSERTVAVVQWAARRHMARVSAQWIIDSDLWAERQADAWDEGAAAEYSYGQPGRYAEVRATNPYREAVTRDE